MKSPEAKDALLSFLQLIPENKRKDLVAVTPRALGIDQLYHMSRDTNIRQFSPSVTKRSAPGEDRSIPRISTAMDWAGCVLGYQSDVNDWVRRETTSDAAGNPVPFKGGWIVYGLPFEYALRPGPSLVPDAKRSGEMWLVTYAQYNIDYRPRRLAKVFYDSYSQKATGARQLDTEIVVVIEVLPECSLRVTPSLTLPTGYYRLRIHNLHRSASHAQVDIREMRELSTIEYRAMKNISAGLLSLDTVTPAYASW